MASAAEQLAASMNFGAFAKATDLQKRIWFTLAALLVFRLGTYIPLPGINAAAFASLFGQNLGLLQQMNQFAGGAVERMSIFTLNIMPYISASIIVQLLSAVSPQMEALKKEGEAGRKKLNQYTRYGTIILALIQSYGITLALESQNVVLNPGIMFRVSSVASLSGGTMFLLWLGEQITSRGIGNGTSLIIFAGIVAQLPVAIIRLLSPGSGFSPVEIILILAAMVALVALVVFVERAQRRILVQYPKQQQGNRMVGGQSSHMPLKLNATGVIPPIFASSLLLLPTTFGSMLGDKAPQWLQTAIAALGYGQPGHLVLFAVLIIFFSFFYTAIVFNPTETADNLRKYGGYVPGYRPGKPTADHFDYVLSRITVIGAIYLVFVCILPEIAINQYKIPFRLGGTGLMIAVTVTMDTVAQIQSYLIAHQYEGLIRKNRPKGSRRG